MVEGLVTGADTVSPKKDNLILAIDLGGTQLRAALVDAAGQILVRESTRTDSVGGPEAVIAQIGELSKRLITGSSGSKIACAGISCPGPLDTREGRTFKIATLAGYDGFPFAKRARDILGIPVVLEHDGHAAAFGEWKQGAGRGFEDFIYLTISTGLGGGAIMNGQLLRGAGGMAAHVGHMTIDPDGPHCGCGNRGCWELYASGTALLARARRLANEKHATLSGRSIDDVQTADIFTAARAGENFACELIDKEADWLGIGIINLMHLYNPARFVIGGGVSNNLDLLIPGIRARIETHAMPAFRQISIVKADLGDNAGLVGAALLAWDRMPELKARL